MRRHESSMSRWDVEPLHRPYRDLCSNSHSASGATNCSTTAFTEESGSTIPFACTADFGSAVVSVGTTNARASSVSHCTSQPAPVVCARIEYLLRELLEYLASPRAHDFPHFDVISRRQQPQLVNGALNLSATRTERVILSPAPSCNPKRYARLWWVMAFVHKLLRCEPPRSTTQRELYYAQPDMFRTQTECNNVILDVASLLRVDRASLGIYSSAKGFFAGSVSVCSEDVTAADATWTDCRTLSANGMSICPATALSQHSLSEHIKPDKEEAEASHGCGYSFRSHDARCILVIEKDGIYNRLLEDRCFDRWPCVLVTGRGFPDLATRALVHALRTQLQVPVYGLCDWNPFGLALLLSYKIGSAAGGAEASRYAVPSMAWLGLRAAQIDRLERESGIALSFKPFTPIDTRKTRAMLKNNEFLIDPQNARWRQELETMQERGRKIDLEAVFQLERGFELFSSEIVHLDIMTGNAIN